MQVTWAHVWLGMLMAGSLSGCVVVGPEDREDVAIQERSMETFPVDSVHLSVATPPHPVSGADHVWEFVVEHRGTEDDEPFPYRGECGSPWGTFLYNGAGDELATTAPRVYCEAIVVDYLEPGDSLSHDWAWNLTRWDRSAESYRTLEAGEYKIGFYFIHLGSDGRIDLERSPRVEYGFTVTAA